LAVCHRVRGVSPRLALGYPYPPYLVTLLALPILSPLWCILYPILSPPLPIFPARLVKLVIYIPPETALNYPPKLFSLCLLTNLTDGLECGGVRENPSRKQTTNQERTNIMTDIQKLIATEIVKQREEQTTWKRRIDSLEVARVQSPRLLELAKAEYRISLHIDETLSDILPKVSELIKAGRS